MTIMVCAKLTFKAVHGELLGGHLGDGAVTDECIDARHRLKYLFCRFSHGSLFRQVQPYE